MRLSLSKVLILATVIVILSASLLALTDFRRKTELNVPNAYYQFIIDNTPYLYYIPGSVPDLTFGKAALAAAFAIDFLN